MQILSAICPRLGVAAISHSDDSNRVMELESAVLENCRK